MRLFGALYDRVLAWSRHRHAPRYLAALSFAESSFFPVPPDVMLAPMSLARPDRALRYALITTVASVAGGVLGYWIGRLAFHLIEPWLAAAGYWDGYLTAHEWFLVWGFWAVLVAGFSPVPYKLFTIAAGVLAMALVPFIIASIIGRGARFFLLAAALSWGGPYVDRVIRRFSEPLGWVGVAALVVLVVWWRM